MVINEIALGITLGFAAWSDWREHKIYNVLLGPAFLLALFLQYQEKGWIGLHDGLIGALIGFSLLLIPYLLGGMGAGDVKLLAVIGAFVGKNFVINSFLYGAVIGGIVSVFLLKRRGALGETLKHWFLVAPFLAKIGPLKEEMSEAKQEKFPYGISLALGTFLAMFMPLGLHWS